MPYVFIDSLIGIWTVFVLPSQTDLPSVRLLQRKIIGDKEEYTSFALFELGALYLFATEICVYLVRLYDTVSMASSSHEKY